MQKKKLKTNSRKPSAPKVGLCFLEAIELIQLGATIAALILISVSVSTIKDDVREIKDSAFEIKENTQRTLYNARYSNEALRTIDKRLEKAFAPKNGAK